MRYISLFFTIAYLFFAILQINDPDPIWWITIYSIPAFVSFKVFKRNINIELLLVLLFLYTSAAYQSLAQISNFEGLFNPNTPLSMKSLNQELARETAGLVISILTFITYLVYGVGKNYLAKQASIRKLAIQ